MTDLEFAYLCVAVAVACALVLSFLCLRLRARLEQERELVAALEKARAAWRGRCMDAEARAHGVGGQAGARPSIKRVQA